MKKKCLLELFLLFLNRESHPKFVCIIYDTSCIFHNKTWKINLQKSRGRFYPTSLKYFQWNFKIVIILSYFTYKTLYTTQILTYFCKFRRYSYKKSNLQNTDFLYCHLFLTHNTAIKNIFRDALCRYTLKILIKFCFKSFFLQNITILFP